jgi:hypothetical protein
MALQVDEANFVYSFDDDMIPRRKMLQILGQVAGIEKYKNDVKMLQILGQVAGTKKYKNNVLGSIGRILPFRQKDFTFPGYRKYGAKETGLYLPNPAYEIIVERLLVFIYRTYQEFIH